MPPVTNGEKALMAPALRRACALKLHWRSQQDLTGVSCVLSELTTLEEASDTILALLMLDGMNVDLMSLAEAAALREVMV